MMQSKDWMQGYQTGVQTDHYLHNKGKTVKTQLTMIFRSTKVLVVQLKSSGGSQPFSILQWRTAFPEGNKASLANNVLNCAGWIFLDFNYLRLSDFLYFWDAQSYTCISISKHGVPVREKLKTTNLQESLTPGFGEKSGKLHVLPNCY